WSMVAHEDLGPAFVDRAHGDGDRAPAMAVGVVEEHLEDLADDALARSDGDPYGRHAQRQPASLLGEPPTPALLELREQGDELTRRVRARMVSRDAEQRVDRSLEPVDLGQRAIKVAGTHLGELERLELQAQRGERGAQLMGRVGAER